MKTKRLTKIVAMLMVACILLTSSITAAFAATDQTANRVVNPKMTSQNWMGFLPNGANMSYINLPGTHDSGTNEIMSVEVTSLLWQVVKLTSIIPIVGDLTRAAFTLAPTVGLVGYKSLNPFAKDQNRTISQQLNDGVRLLDCRLSCYDKEEKGPQNLTLSHGGFKCVDEKGNDLRFDAVLNDVKSFLKAHPTETVVVQMQEEGLPFNFTGHDNAFVDAMIKALNLELETYFDVEDIKDIKPKAKKIMLKFLEECRKDKDFIVVDDDTDYPTVGQSRGKIILTTDEFITTDDKEPKKTSGDYHVTGKGKWNNLTDPDNGMLNGKEVPLDYTKMPDYNSVRKDKPEIKEEDKKRICPRLAATSCASDSDGAYFGDAVKLFIGNASAVGEFAKLIGTPIEDPDAVSPGHMHARVVNPLLKSYDWQKGKFYGWIYTDFEDEELCKKIYETNLFDFDIAGHPLTYIKEIKIAFEQTFDEAKKNLEDGGYTVFKFNFNEEGPDKGLSDAVVNGRKNHGSFNMAIGYKTTDDPGEALTGIKWTTKEKETDYFPQNVQDMLSKGKYELIDLYSTDVEAKTIKTSQGLSDLNIGTAGKLVNLYGSYYGGAGERLTDLTTVKDYNKIKVDIKTGKAINTRVINKAKAEIATNFENEFDTVRDANGYTLSSNYGRNNINDIQIFYKTAFSTKSATNAYFPMYDGEGAGQIREIEIR